MPSGGHRIGVVGGTQALLSPKASNSSLRAHKIPESSMEVWCFCIGTSFQTIDESRVWTSAELAAATHSLSREEVVGLNCFFKNAHRGWKDGSCRAPALVPSAHTVAHS